MPDKRYRIIYEDEAIMVVDKPSGMLVIPTPKKEKNTLTDFVNKYLDEKKLEINAYPCHRLDRETSGIVIYAKGKRIQSLMMDEFRKRAVKKAYIAFVRGNVKKDFDTIENAIYNRNKDRNEAAITRYRVLERRDVFTVVEAEPVTGRTNQIRIHFAMMGHPILGETIYAFRKDFKIRFKRVALHALRIAFMHPVTKEEVVFSAPIAPDMEKFLKKRRQ